MTATSPLRSAFSGQSSLCSTQPADRLGGLPLELKHHVLSFLPLTDIGRLSQCSRTWTRLCTQWVSSAKAINRVAAEPPRIIEVLAEQEQNRIEEDRSEIWLLSLDTRLSNVDSLRSLNVPSKSPCAALSILLKRLSCLNGTEERLRFLFRMVDVMLKRQKLFLIRDLQLNWSDTLWDAMQAIQFANMLQLFIRGWDYSEFKHVLTALDRKLKLRSALTTLFQENDAFQVDEEIKLRLNLRCIMWDFAGLDYTHRAVWLTKFMSHFSVRSAQQQAMVLYLLFGSPCHYPESHGIEIENNPLWGQALIFELNTHTNWEICKTSTAQDFHEGKGMFYLTAQALCSCSMSMKDWQGTRLAAVLEALFEELFLHQRENIAGFLLFCSETIILSYLHWKIKEKAYRQVARLLVDMVVMAHRFENDLHAERGIGKIFNEICSDQPLEGRNELHGEIWKELSNFESLDVEFEPTDINEVIQKLWMFILKKAYGDEITPAKDAVHDKLDNDSESLYEDIEE